MLGDRGMPSDVPTGTRNPWALPGSPPVYEGSRPWLPISDLPHFRCSLNQKAPN
jgi:hypothetical protein